tara:strand:+ start:182 stop:475 length:294 start_codon:yes stop_codon:yes gene_type:complete
MLDGYNKEELIHIVDMYNLNIDMETLKKSKKEIMKEMAQVPKKVFKDSPLPNKKEVKEMVLKDKAKKSSLINKVAKNKPVKRVKAPEQKNKITNYTK